MNMPELTNGFPNGSPPSHHPIEVGLPICFTIIGLAILLIPPSPGSVAATLPHLVVLVWGMGLGIGGLITLVSQVLHRRSVGIYVEQVGSVFIAVGALLYAVAVFFFAPLSAAIAAGGIFFIVSVSYVWRWVQLRRILNSVAKRAAMLRSENGGS